jgi:hypothetical protein
MGRKKIWLGTFKSLKVKIYDEKYRRYKMILDGRNKTIQEDLEEHVNKTIN